MKIGLSSVKDSRFCLYKGNLLLIGLLLLGCVGPVLAVTVLPGLPTAFEIDSPDGDKDNDGSEISVTGASFDWEDIFTGTPAAPGSPNANAGPYSFSFNFDDPNTVAVEAAVLDVESTGIVASTFNQDFPEGANACSGSGLDIDFTNGASLNTNPWVPVASGGGPNNKADSCSGGAALEVVKINADNGGFPTAADTDPFEQIHYILYNFWTRSEDATGEIFVHQVLRGSIDDIDSDTEEYRCDDILITFNYDSSTSGVITVNSQVWLPTGSVLADLPLPVGTAACDGPGEWVDSGNAVGVGVGGFNTDTVFDFGNDNPPGGNGQNAPAQENTFGESAIDLTSAGILPEGDCTTFVNEGYITKTGEGSSAALIDSFSFANPITISNCTDVEISKEANGLSQGFEYVLDQTDNFDTHQPTGTDDGNLNEANELGSDTDASTGSISSLINSWDTHLWENVFAEPDYTLAETIPANLAPFWSLESIVCTYYDPFLGATIVDDLAQDDTGQVPGFVDETGGETDVFVIPPPITTNIVTSCVITNETSVPTSATVGGVSVSEQSIDQFLAAIGVDGLSQEELLELLSTWGADVASDLFDADIATIQTELRDFLDPDGDQSVAVLIWHTFEERGTIGFYVERKQGDGDWIRVNESILPSLIVAPMGAEYQLVDPAVHSGGTYEYQLIEQEASGMQNTYGPYIIEVE